MQWYKYYVPEPEGRFTIKNPMGLYRAIGMKFDAIDRDKKWSQYDSLSYDVRYGRADVIEISKEDAKKILQEWKFSADLIERLLAD